MSRSKRMLSVLKIFHLCVWFTMTIISRVNEAERFINIFPNPQYALTSFIIYQLIHETHFICIQTCLFTCYKDRCRRRCIRNELTILAVTDMAMFSSSKTKYLTTNDCKTTYTSIHYDIQ